jgi:hypothetical protein
MKAARTESDLESHTLTGPLADELAKAQARAERVNPDPRRARARAPALAPEPERERKREPEPKTPNLNLNLNPFPDPLSRADVVDADPLHLSLIAALIGDAHLLWARSTGTHAVWCERRAGKDVLRVIRVEGARIVQHWSFD